MEESDMIMNTVRKIELECLRQIFRRDKDVSGREKVAQEEEWEGFVVRERDGRM